MAICAHAVTDIFFVQSTDRFHGRYERLGAAVPPKYGGKYNHLIAVPVRNPIAYTIAAVYLADWQITSALDWV